MKRTLVLLVIVFAATILCQSAWAFSAQDEAKGFNFSVNTSAVMPTEDGAETGIYVNGLLSYDVVEYFAIGIESGYMQYDFEEQGTDLGSLRGLPLLADFIVKNNFEADNFTIVPYGIVGVGALFSDFDESSIVEDADVSVDTETAFLMKFGGGLDFYLTDMLALNFEASYTMTDIDASAAWKGQTYATDTLNGNSWLVGGGVKLRF